MSYRQGRPFYPLDNSTAPSFNSTANEAVAALYALASTVRVWQGPSNRAVRLTTNGTTEDFYFKFGTSDAVAASTDSTFVPGGVPVVVYVNPSQTHLSLVSAGSTIGSVNVTLGYGG